MQIYIDHFINKLTCTSIPALVIRKCVAIKEASDFIQCLQVLWMVHRISVIQRFIATAIFNYRFILVLIILVKMMDSAHTEAGYSIINPELQCII